MAAPALPLADTPSEPAADDLWHEVSCIPLRVGVAAMWLGSFFLGCAAHEVPR